MTEWIRNIAIVVGVFVAWKQIDSWRREKISLKKGELGEELFATVSEVAEKLSGVRSPIGFGPPQGEIDDGTFDYKRRLQEIANMNSDFQKLRQLNVRQKAFLGDAPVESSINDLFDIRAKLIAALEGRIRSIRGGSQFGEKMSDSAMKRVEKQDTIIWEGYGDEDPIKSKVDEALKIIEDRMVPLIRLEVSK